ncbi:MAG TPA: BatA domain-containing protein [Puia sp.]|uniref:BatA domain-containing protein n=1 Tax=Puia sp. TaxID=2045100 RepID=UPI002CEABED7|nr:BatA domain-containing protein [Puia sp.]HVU95153.1 BatA domain-containing protein [Puia sp.]
MIHFLQPIGLLAMAGIVIPVIVHLWKDRRGKVLRIGSVALLTGGAARAAWSPRLTELLLLLLRCLLVIALAGLLAGPYYFRPASRRKWVLVAGRNSIADSLVKVGFERHALDSGVNYWDAFRRMDSVAPAGVAFFVFTPDLLSGFAGSRPVTSREVHWEVYPAGDSVERWVEGAYRVSADSVLVTRGVSRATGTSFSKERVALRADRFEGIAVDTAAVAVMVDDGGDVRRGRQIRAALKALEEYTGRRIRVGAAGTVVRWRPEWDEAAWDGRLPVVLGELIFPGGVSDKDRRVIDPEQAEPVHVAGAAGGVTERVDLRPLLWVIVLVLFVLERIKAFHHGRQKA